MASCAARVSQPGVWRAAIPSIPVAMIPHGLERGGPDDGKARNPRGGADGGGVHRVPDVLLPGAAAAEATRKAGGPDDEPARAGAHTDTGRAGSGSGRSSARFASAAAAATSGH